MNLKALIIDEADHCVKCGLCLPRCPTYVKNRNEADSPRGRIALMQGLAQGHLADSPALRRHLDGCLGCRACEAACPSTVAYGRLLDAGRALLDADVAAQAPRPETRLLMRPRQTRRWLRLYQLSGLQRLARTLGLPGRLGMGRQERYLTPLPPRRLKRSFYPARGRERGRVALFTGCAGWIFEQPPLAAAVRLLTSLGFAVHVPPDQQCCGALHLHRGDLGRARALAEANGRCFNSLGVDAVVYLASGCGLTLGEYTELHRLTGGAPLAWRAPVEEICGFLARQDWPEARIRPTEASVLLHEPCSLKQIRNGCKGVQALLAKVPGLHAQALANNGPCCGAAGDYMFREPAMADALLADQIARLREAAPTTLLTTNTGCALHLRRGIREAGLAVTVRHPVEVVKIRTEC